MTQILFFTSYSDKKNQVAIQVKNSNWDKTQKLKFLHNSKTKIFTKLAVNLKGKLLNTKNAAS